MVVDWGAFLLDFGPEEQCMPTRGRYIWDRGDGLCEMHVLDRGSIAAHQRHLVSWVRYCHIFFVPLLPGPDALLAPPQLASFPLSSSLPCQLPESPPSLCRECIELASFEPVVFRLCKQLSSGSASQSHKSVDRCFTAPHRQHDR
jgi:hypothetical protein